MIQHADTTKCETNMADGRTAFTIQANAKMFKILSSGLYSNKIRAIIREVSCNAYDANVDAGNGDIPIEVQLPNVFESVFSIKDRGTGLTPEQMKDIYTQYGNSTKTGRNDQIGALGLGSKSPFSYIDSFNVISITNGLKNTYTCYIDGNGEPQLQPFGSAETTDEPNGVEVTFPVKQEDFNTFRREAEIVYRPFEVRPTVTGNSDYQVKEFKVLLTSDETLTADWQLVDPIKKDRYDSSTIRVAVQGNIEYPLNTDLLEDKLSENAKHLINENYRLHFDIGELDIAASREELGYDKVTIENIVAKFEVMAAEIAQKQNDELNEYATKYEAMRYVSSIRNETKFYKDFKFKYKDEEISNTVRCTGHFEVFRYFMHNQNVKRTVMNKDANLNGNKFSIVIPGPSEDVTWVFNDNDKKSQAVSKARSLVAYGKVVYLVDDIRLFDEIGNPDYINASEMDSPTKRAPGSSNNTERGKFFKKFSHRTYADDQWKNSYYNAQTQGLDLDEKFYYVELKGRYEINSTNLLNTLKIAKEIGLIDNDLEVWGVRSSHVNTKRFSTNYDAVEFTKFISDKIKKSRKFKSALKDILEVEIRREIEDLDGRYLSLLRDEDFIKSLPKDNIFRRVRKDQARVLKVDKQTVRTTQIVADQLGIKIPTSTKYELANELERAYPLLAYMHSNAPKKDVLVYINAIDSSIEAPANQTKNKKASSEGKSSKSNG